MGAHKAFTPAIVGMSGQIYADFLRLLWVLADKYMRSYYEIMGKEAKIRTEAFRWARAKVFNCNKTSVGRAIVSVTLYAVIFSLASVQVQSGGVAILRWFLACLQASSTVLLILLLPLRPRAVVTTCLRKVKHRITASLRVPRLAVPPLSLTVSTRKPMFARMPPSFPGMPMSVRAL